jgi:hypothetical protein
VAHPVSATEACRSLDGSAHEAVQIVREIVYRARLRGLVLLRLIRVAPSRRSSWPHRRYDTVSRDDAFAAARMNPGDDELLPGRTSDTRARGRWLREIPDLRRVGKQEDDGDLTGGWKERAFGSH